jgi:hypothetical protein
MKFRHLLKALAFGAALISVAPAAQAGPITLDFEAVQPDLGGGFAYANLTTGGFRLSPACHVHHMLGADSPRGFGGSSWISWDGAGCPAAGNPDYVGADPSGDFLHVDRFDAPFTLESLYFVGPGEVRSSKGGVASADDLVGELVNFAGPEWTDIQWLLFDGCDCGAPAVGIDELTVRIEEPMSLPLFATGGLAAIALLRRGRALSPTRARRPARA